MVEMGNIADLLLLMVDGSFKSLFFKDNNGNL